MHYNESFIKTYSRLVCPPYDIIDKRKLSKLRKRSSYNFSNVLIADGCNYEKIAKTLSKWLKDKILVQNSKESLYLYEQKFHLNGKEFRRFGMLSLLKMDGKTVFPHENTLEKPKEDRRRIIEAVKANLSPVFVIASNRLTVLEKFYNNYRRKEPFLKFKDDEGDLNTVWVISDKKQIELIRRDLEKNELVIADGHHRFEITYNYFQKNKGRFKDLEYILAYITDCQKGLIILPTHRVARINDNDKVFFDKLNRYFTVKKLNLNNLKERLAATKEFCLGLYHRKKAYFLRLKDRSVLKSLPNRDLTGLDTYVFHQLVLPLFEVSGNIEYSHDFKEACKMADSTKTVFFLRAASLDSVINISRKGLKFPQKSTYFYPKVLSGIVMRRFVKY